MDLSDEWILYTTDINFCITVNLWKFKKYLSFSLRFSSWHTHCIVWRKFLFLACSLHVGWEHFSSGHTQCPVWMYFFWCTHHPIWRAFFDTLTTLPKVSFFWTHCVRWKFFFLAHSLHCLIREFFSWHCLKIVLLYGTLTVPYDETVSVNIKVTSITQHEICSFRLDTCSFFGAFIVKWCAWLDNLSSVGMALSLFLSITCHLPNFLLLSQSKPAFRYNRMKSTTVFHISLSVSHTHTHTHRGADKSLPRPGRKQATATKDFDVHISYL
jgi:hypothetical protein